MPYYIYRITQHGPIKMLAKVTQFETFKPASEEAKRLRRELELAPGEIIKTVFAENELQAEELLNETREDVPRTGEDW
jgi:hypothetical protein